MTARLQTNPTTAFQTTAGWYAGRKAVSFRQKCNLVHASSSFTLGYLPKGARLLWSVAIAQAAISVTGSDATNTANSYGLFLSPTTATAQLTQPQTVTVSSPSGGTNGYMASMVTDTSSSGAFRGPPRFETTAPAVNTNTVGALMTLQPMYTNSNRVYANGTNGFIFGTSTVTSTVTYPVYVTGYYEVYDDAPSFTA